MARSVLTLPEAAQFLGVPPEELSLLRQSGALPAQQEAGEWVFNRTDLERVADGYLRPDPRRPAPYEAESPPVADNSDDDSDHALLGGALGASPVELTPQADDSGMLWQALNLDDQEVSSLAQPILDGVPTPPADAPRNGKEPRSTPPGVLEGRLLSDPSLAPNGRASVGPPGTPAPRESEPSDMHFSSFDEFDDSGDLEFGEPDSADLAPATDEELSREDSLILDGVPLLDGGFVVPPPIESGLNPFDGPGALDAMLEGPEANRWPGPPSSANSSSLSVFDEAISPTGSTASPNSGSSPGAPSPAPTSAVDFPSLSFDEHEPSNVSLDRLLGGDAFFGSAAPTSAGGGKAPVDRRGPASDLSPPDSNGPEDFPSLSFDQHEPSRAKLDRSFGPTEFAPAVEGSSLPPPNRPTDESSRALNWAADDDGELDRILGDAGEEFGSSASTEAPHDPFADLLSGDEPPLESPSGDAMPLSTAPSGPSGSGAFSHLDAPDAEDYSGLDLDTPLWSGGEPTPSGPLRSVSSYSDFDAPDDPPGALPDGGQDYTVDPHAEIHATDVEFSEIDLDAPGATVVVPGNTRMIEELREHAARTRRDEREVSGDFSSLNIPVESTEGGGIALPEDEDDTVQIETFDSEPSGPVERPVSLSDLRGHGDERPVYDPASTDSPWIDPDPSDTSIQTGPSSHVESPFEHFGTAPQTAVRAGWESPTHVELAHGTDEASHVFNGEFGATKSDDDPPTLESQLAAVRQGEADDEGPRPTDEPSLPPWLLPPRPPGDSDAIARPLDDEFDEEVLGAPEPGAPQAPTLIGMGHDFEAVHPGAVRMTTEDERLSDSQLVSNAPTMIGRSSGEFDALNDAVNVNSGYGDSSLMSSAPSLIGPTGAGSNAGGYVASDLDVRDSGMALDDLDGDPESADFGLGGGSARAGQAQHEFAPPSGADEFDDASSSVFDDEPRERSALAESLSDEFVVAPKYSPNTVYFDPFRESPSVEFLNDIDLSALTTDVVELPSPSRLSSRMPGQSGVTDKPAIEKPAAEKPAAETPALGGATTTPSVESISSAAASLPGGEAGDSAETPDASSAVAEETPDRPARGKKSGKKKASASLTADEPTPLAGELASLPTMEATPGALASVPEVAAANEAVPANEIAVGGEPVGEGEFSSSVWSSTEPDLNLTEALQSSPDEISTTPVGADSAAASAAPKAAEPEPVAPAIDEPFGREPLPTPARPRMPISLPLASSAPPADASSMLALTPELTTGFARSPLTSSRVASGEGAASAEDSSLAASDAAASTTDALKSNALARPTSGPSGRAATDANEAPQIAPASAGRERFEADDILLGLTVAVMVLIGFVLGGVLMGIRPAALRSLFTPSVGASAPTNSKPAPGPKAAQPAGEQPTEATAVATPPVDANLPTAANPPTDASPAANPAAAAPTSVSPPSADAPSVPATETPSARAAPTDQVAPDAPAAPASDGPALPAAPTAEA